MSNKYAKAVDVIRRYHQARSLMRVQPHITGAELARRMGLAERTGQYYRGLVLTVGPIERKPKPVRKAKPVPPPADPYAPPIFRKLK